MSVPAGTIMAFAGSKEVLKRIKDWKLCDGSKVSRDDYPDLFNAIGTIYGGDGVPTFTLPDFRGLFLRGVDDGAGRDPDVSTRTPASGSGEKNKVGSTQGDGVKQHSHATAAPLPKYSDAHATFAGSAPTDHHVVEFGHNAINVAGDNEGRPKNIYVYYIIKTRND